MISDKKQIIRLAKIASVLGLSTNNTHKYDFLDPVIKQCNHKLLSIMLEYNLLHRYFWINRMREEDEAEIQRSKPFYEKRNKIRRENAVTYFIQWMMGHFPPFSTIYTSPIIDEMTGLKLDEIFDNYTVVNSKYNALIHYLDKHNIKPWDVQKKLMEQIRYKKEHQL